MLIPGWRRALIVALVFLPARSIRAQEILTIEEATRQALAGNATLRASQEAAAEGAAGISEARAGWFPRLSVAESWQRGDQPVFVFGSLLASRQFAAANFAIDALNHPDAIAFHRTSIGIVQPLFDGRQGAEVERARLTHDAAKLAFDESRAALAVGTADAYGRVLAAESSHRAIEGALEAARADRLRAAARRDAGMATDADVLALEAHVAALAQRRVQADADAAIARAELNRLMGAPIERTYRVVEPPPPAVEGHEDLDALLAEADAARPALRRATTIEALVRNEGRQARAALLPSVTAQAGVDVSGTRLAARTSSWLVGAEARWTLSLGGAERARLQAASHAQARAAAEADDTRAGVHVEVVSALTARRSAAARIEAGRAAIAQARESERIVRDRFEAGLAGVTDLLRAQGAVLDAEALRTAAGVDAIVSAARLSRALGRQP